MKPDEPLSNRGVFKPIDPLSLIVEVPGVEFQGAFETHITIGLETGSDLEAVAAWARVQGLKFHHIVLARGQTPSQPMVSRRGEGTLSGEKAEALSIAGRLTESGFPVARIKIEAAPWNKEVPESDDEARVHHDGRYFEHHLKLALAPDTDLDALVRLAVRHEAHLSRNARRVREDGRSERFVTQRCYRVGRTTAAGRLKALADALKGVGLAIISVEEEFVVYDNAPGVDAGWLSTKEAPR